MKDHEKASKRKAVLGAVAGVMVASAAHAGSVAGNGGATEVTQILNNVQLIEQTSQQLQQIQQVGQQLQYMKYQMKNLQGSPTEIWGQAQTLLERLARLVSRSNGLGYTAGNIAQKFQQTYPGYQPTTDYGQQYGKWTQQSMQGISVALQSAGMQAGDFATEQQSLNQIRAISANSPGALQAIQAGNMISSNMADQLMELRQLETTQMNAQDGWLATQQQVQSGKAATTEQFMKQGNGSIRKPGQSGFQSFGTLNFQPQ